MPQKLSIVVPAYNEALRLGDMLDAYLPHFARTHGSAFELIVVVNGSRDATEAIACSYQERYPQLVVIVEKRAIGKGGAIILGMRHAGGDWIGFVDADGSTPPAAFYDLLNYTDQADVVIASRWHPAAHITLRQPWSRRLISRVFNLTVRLLFQLRVRDTQCGAKIVSRAAINKVLPLLGITRWAFDVDLLFQLQRHGFKMIEVPTEWHDVAGSRLRVWHASIEMLVALIRLRLIYSPLRWIVKFYDRTLGVWIHAKK